jgi:hypothetical protein
MIKHSIKAKQNTTIAGILVGMAVTISISILGAIIGALLISNDVLSENSVLQIAIGAWAIGSFAGGVVCIRISHDKKIPALLFLNACCFFLSAAMGILFFETNFGRIIPVFLAMILGNIPVVIMLINGNENRKRKKHYKIK